MPWWTSLLLIGLALNVWLSGRRNPDEVIGLLEKLLAALLVVVVLWESRNVVLEGLALLVVLQLPALPRRPSRSAIGLRLHLPDRNPAGTREPGMGCLHRMAQITGLEHLLAPVLTAVVGDGVLMQGFVVHGATVAASVMAQVFNALQEPGQIQQCSFTVRGSSSSSSPSSLSSG